MTLVSVLSCASGSLLSLLFIFVACFVFELNGAAVVYRPPPLMKHGVCFCGCPMLFFFFGWFVCFERAYVTTAGSSMNWQRRGNGRWNGYATVCRNYREALLRGVYELYGRDCRQDLLRAV